MMPATATITAAAVATTVTAAAVTTTAVTTTPAAAVSAAATVATQRQRCRQHDRRDYGHTQPRLSTHGIGLLSTQL